MPYDFRADPMRGFASSAASPSRTAYAVTPSDGADLTSYAKALYIGVTGDVVVVPVLNEDGASVTFKAHPVGYLPVQVRRVLATGTTATNILALSA